MKKMTFTMALVAMAMISCGNSYETKTVALNSQIDSLNYALGYSNGAQIKMYYLQGDSTHSGANEFLEALEKGYKTNAKEISQARQAGESVGQAVKQMETKGIADIKEWAINEKIFFQGMVNGFHHDETVMTASDAQNYFQTQYTAGHNDSIEAKVVKAKCGTTVKDITLNSRLDSINYAFGFMNGDAMASSLIDPDTTGTAIKDLVMGINSGLKSKVKNPQLVGLGKQIGTSIKEQEPIGLLGEEGLETKFDLIFQGFTNGLYGYEEQMNNREAGQYVQSTMDDIKYGANKAEGAAFLANNGTRPEVKTTESGLQYEIIKQGKGKKPTAQSTVRVHYAGTLIDGTEFDSSYKRGEPTTFGVTQVIPGWTEGLQLMNVGSKFKFYIPYELAYGERQAGNIPPYSTLIFEVELLGIE